MTITFRKATGTTMVGKLRYKDTFQYGGHYYIRVDSHQVLNTLFSYGGRGLNTGTGSLNTRGAVVVCKLSNGRLSYFKRETMVTPCDMVCEVEQEI